MEKHVTCSATFELEAFHPPAAPIAAPSETRTLSVQFGFASDDAANDVAKTDFAVFLEAVRGVRLLPCRFTVSGDVVTLTPANGVTVDMTEWTSPTGLPGLMQWLGERSGNMWTAPKPLRDDGEIDYRVVAAPHLLHATAGWDAPLPQTAGITRLARITSTGPLDVPTMMLVPWFDASTPGTITGTVTRRSNGKPIDVDLRNVDSGQLTELVIATHPLELPGVDPGDLVDEATGYLKVLPRGIEISDALRRIREHAPSLLWTMPQLLALDWNEESVDPTTKKPPTIVDLGRAIWRGMSGLATLADPLLLALTMAGTTREGPFVSALIAVLEEMNNTGEHGEFGAFKTEHLADAVTGLILEHAGPGASPAKRAAILAKAFDIPMPAKDALDKETDLLPVVLRIYAEFGPADFRNADFNRAGARARYGNTLDRQIAVELGRLAKFAQDEDAVEAAALRVLAHVGIDAEWLRLYLEHPDLPDKPAAQAHAASALATFTSVVKESFNGLDATRFAQGSLLEAALVTEAGIREQNGWDDAGLAARLLESGWFAGRLGISTFSIVGTAKQITLGSIAASLPVIDLAYLDAAHRDPLHSSDGSGRLDQSLLAVVADLFPRSAATRFLPDTSPRNLPVQIAVDTDIADGDTFEARFNGVALLVHRDAQSWRYANYATLKLNYPNEEIADNPVIHPLQPVAIDGQRRLFLEYAGVPIASRAFDTTFAVDAAEKQPLEQHKPFYEIDDPEFPEAQKEKRLPALVYGSTYGIAAHVVGKAGALPRKLQRFREMPWLPNDAPALPADSRGVVRDVMYLRTTAIGRVMLNETAQRARGPRIGAAIEGVTPLAGDYPRSSLAARGQATAVLDVLRNADGTGALTLPKDGDKPFDLVIRDLWWWGAAGNLTIDVLNQSSALPDDRGAATIAFPGTAPFAGGSIALRIESNASQRVFSLGVSKTSNAADELTPVLTVPMKPDDPLLGGNAPAWLRLRLSGAGTTVSFADPTRHVRTDHSASRASNESLLVMAPTDGPEWRPDLKESVTAALRFPQVGFIDFDRWFSNDACRARAFPKTSDDPNDDAAKAPATAFHNAVMTAYLGRMFDPSLAALVDAMPDLAVSALRLDLCVVDGLRETPSNIVKKALTPTTASVPIAPLGDRWKKIVDGTPQGTIHGRLRRLAASSRATLKITCSGETLKLEPSEVLDDETGLTMWQVVVTVPRGVVARLRVRAVVPEAFFGDGASPLKVVDPRLRQLAVGHDGDVYLFDGPSLTIEGMSEELKRDSDQDLRWIDLARKTIVPVPAGKARVYSLVARHTAHDETDAWNWRKLASVDVQTQRWRFTGRPIYNWIDPKKRGGMSSNAAVVVETDTTGLDDFESEAFFDRDEQDADTQMKQLDPGPTETVLQTFPWELPSATMFRHRVTLRSRYAGALLAGFASTQRGYATTQARPGQRTREDWYRVVMLADRTRLQLTRPQLRALIPLTAGPTSDESEAATPPVMAVLQEPPFAHGGLADRVAAEIRTGFGFGFKPDREQVHVIDARKEVGPDPRLTYAATTDVTARALTVESEGPIGLTFDTPSAPAPTFANTAWLLRPRLANAENASAGSLEEHFMSVALRRYLDPRWLIDDDPPISRGPVAIGRPCWLQFDEGFTVSAGPLAVLGVQRSDAGWAAEFNPVAVDPKGPQDLLMEALATAGAGFAEELALLHLPIEEGRASLTLLALPAPGLRRSTRAGNIATAPDNDLPHVLASFEWSVPDGVTELTISKDVPVRPTSASPVTRMNWTRTGKSFDVLYARDRAGVEGPVYVATLGGVIDRAKRTATVVRRDAPNEPLHLLTHMEGNPLFVHRHLAVVITVMAGGIGRPMEVYRTARRVVGSTLPRLDLGDQAASAMRVVTFETPARPVGFNTSLPGMQSAMFDLYAVMGDKYENATPPRGVTFTYRPLGGSLKSLGFSITYAGQPAQRIGIDLETAHQTVTPTAVHFSVIDKTVRWTVVFPDGSTQEKTIASTLDLDLTKPMRLQNEKIEVRPEGFTSPGGTIYGEYWGDISMLTVPLVDNDPASFEWNWLFTGRDLGASDAVQAARLVSMAEAEARIVAVSPPIPILDVS